jgi:hypothetical protein
MQKNQQNQENSRAAHRLKRRAEALRANLRRRKDATQPDAEAPEPAESDPNPASTKIHHDALKS